MKTLEKFLEKNRACKEGFDFAKDLTLEQFLSTCERGDWILWLFARINPNSLCELTLTKGHCANTVRHLMKDQRSTKAVDVAIAFGENKATREELDAAAAGASAASHAANAAVTSSVVAASAHAASHAANAAVFPTAFAAFAAYAAGAADAWAAAYAAVGAAFAAYAAVAADAWAAAYAAVGAASASAARKQNQKETADICRKYLPLKIWDQSKI